MALVKLHPAMQLLSVAVWFGALCVLWGHEKGVVHPQCS